jgi:putative endonuclease
MAYYVYILLCTDDSYYTGYTKDLKTRLLQHASGRGAKYTQIKKPEKIVYIEWFKTRKKAMHREKEIKKLTHREKTELIKQKSNKRKAV